MRTLIVTAVIIADGAGIFQIRTEHDFDSITLPNQKGRFRGSAVGRIPNQRRPETGGTVQMLTPANLPRFVLTADDRLWKSAIREFGLALLSAFSIHCMSPLVMNGRDIPTFREIDLRLRCPSSEQHVGPAFPHLAVHCVGHYFACILLNEYGLDPFRAV